MKNVIKTQSQIAKCVAASLLALGSPVICGEALAQQVTAIAGPSEHPNSQPVTKRSVTYPVRYSDLDVSKLNGAKTLYLRIRHAAEVVCESAATWGRKEGDACVRKAIDDAVARADAPLLSQYYQLRSMGDKAGLVQLAKAN